MRFQSACIICTFACIFANHGVDVIVAADGKNWATNKKSISQKGAERERAWIRAMIASELAHILQSNNRLLRK